MWCAAVGMTLFEGCSVQSAIVRTPAHIAPACELVEEIRDLLELLGLLMAPLRRASVRGFLRLEAQACLWAPRRAHGKLLRGDAAERRRLKRPLRAPNETGVPALAALPKSQRERGSEDSSWMVSPAGFRGSLAGFPARSLPENWVAARASHGAREPLCG